ncbi:gamma-glutamyltransferase [Sneathiella marina]|uniref:Glutathione hydrolase proenzyme n=1 Tax=Sneathiella marina TaxID=2950108 RepID=A0ABY4W3K1_9PROT|nr:gamma-glutamyltransferase [Sneathiella marina]USG61768.1 gamma-glutamyltransferase [Sneathiella marina]
MSQSAFFRRASIKTLVLTAAILASLTSISSAQEFSRYMISAANPHAAKAGRNILEKGGSAVDAAIATQMVLTLVEPQSSGIGGGAFMLYFDGENQAIETYDGREMAPAAVEEDHFLTSDGTRKKFYDAVVGGGSVGVPGVVAMMELAYQDHGILPWKMLFQPAIKLAREGFPVSERLYFLLERDKFLKTKATAAKYFYLPDGTAKPVGTILKNPELADTLERIAQNGSKAFYHGKIATDIVTAVQSDLQNPGLLTEADLANYHAVMREPVCADYRENTVCGMGPPTSGGITVLQILKILENWDMSTTTPGSPEAIHLISQASALAFADRNKYLGDADYVDIPASEMLSETYISSQAKRVAPAVSQIPFTAGRPSEKQGSLSIDNAIELPSTSHFSIIDQEGNAVSMTTSVENVFGSRLMVDGFILNNQLTDFSFNPAGENGPVNNRIQPGKRPRSSMSPTMVLDDGGNLQMVIGSPGGSRIIGYVASTVIAVLDWDMDMQSAIEMPHHINRNGTLDLEKDTSLASHQSDLEKMGYKVKLRSLNSGLHGILVTKEGLQGGADPRREGIVLDR